METRLFFVWQLSCLYEGSLKSCRRGKKVSHRNYFSIGVNKIILKDDGISFWAWLLCLVSNWLWRLLVSYIGWETCCHILFMFMISENYSERLLYNIMIKWWFLPHRVVLIQVKSYLTHQWGTSACFYTLPHEGCVGIKSHCHMAQRGGCGLKSIHALSIWLLPRLSATWVDLYIVFLHWSGREINIVIYPVSVSLKT